MASGRKSGFSFGGGLDAPPATPAPAAAGAPRAPFTGGVTPIVAAERSAFLEGDYFGLRDARDDAALADAAPLFTVPDSAGKKRRRSADAAEAHGGHGGHHGGLDADDADASRLTLAGAGATQQQQMTTTTSTTTQTQARLRAQLAGLRRQLETEQLRAKQERSRAERDLRKEQLRTKQETQRARDLEEEVSRMRREKQRLEMEAVRARQSSEAALDRARREVRDLDHAKHVEIQVLKDESKELAEEIRTLREALEIKQEEDDDDDDEEKPAAAAAASRAEAQRAAHEATKLRSALEVAQISLREARAEIEDQRVEIRALQESSAVSGRVGELNSALHRAEERESRMRGQLAELQKRLESREDDSLMLEGLRAKIHKLEAQRDDLVQAEAECNALKAERREWSALFGELLETADDVTPMEVLGAVRELQAGQRKISRQLSAAQVRLAEVTGSRENSENSLAGLERALAKAQRELTAATERADALERQNLFLERERKSLLRIIDTVSDEPYATLSKKQQAELANEREARRADIEGLKANLEAAHDRIRELEAAARSERAQGMSPAVVRQRNKQLESTEERVTALQKENRHLEKRLDEALDRVAELEHDEAAGVINPSKTKVLHLTFNPERRALGADSGAADSKDESAVIAVLRSEIADLKAQLQEGGGGDGSRSMGDPIKRHERLKKKFMEWTRTFKEAVYLLTGLKIDMMENDVQAGSGTKILRAKSVYAERSSDELRFRWSTETDALELLETEFARRIDEDVFAYLSNFKSVPAFLAQLQSDLFSRQTVQT